ncbi:hypothetical protein BVG16_01645 [Paenibacillus selenitireducens]|uniref:Hydrolase n=1 Tax=Paenibacillus selenitireducens TaxID=1324314 RepID=A0A1T2XMJ2_9BACL|nr:hypothetical protein [Paenibacillus selenitireducens]OPA81071.1 hypothetical protein BVG16_01645 [Paenibacillus selenitireducens]
MMAKSTYYVSVQSGSILKDQGAAAYEFEIMADQREADDLQHLLEMKMNADDRTYYRAHIPGIPYHIDPENDLYDHYLQQIYQLIYELGTEETKQAMAQMHVLENLEGIGDL